MVMGERIKPSADGRAADTMEEPAGGAARQPSGRVIGGIVGPGDDEPDNASTHILKPPD